MIEELIEKLNTYEVFEYIEISKRRKGSYHVRNTTDEGLGSFHRLSFSGTSLLDALEKAIRYMENMESFKQAYKLLNDNLSEETLESFVIVHEETIVSYNNQTLYSKKFAFDDWKTLESVIKKSHPLIYTAVVKDTKIIVTVVDRGGEDLKDWQPYLLDS